MPEPIGPFSPESIIGAIEDNLVDASVSLGRTEEGVVFRGSDVTWVYTGYPSLSRVLRARFAPDEAEDRVAEIGDCFKEWDAPVSWIVGPTTWPPQLGDKLRDSGFSDGTTWFGMARDLSPTDLSPTDVPPVPADVRVDRATSKPDLAAWAAVGDGSPGPGAASAAVSAIFAPENAGGDPRCRYYLARVNGRPVARGMAFVREETVGLYWMTSDAANRGRGYARAVALQAMADARQTGARLAVTSARADAESIGRQLKFKPYCQYSVHEWPPPPPRVHAH